MLPAPPGPAIVTLPRLWVPRPSPWMLALIGSQAGVAPLVAPSASAAPDALADQAIGSQPALICSPPEATVSPASASRVSVIGATESASGGAWRTRIGLSETLSATLPLAGA